MLYIKRLKQNSCYIDIYYAVDENTRVHFVIKYLYTQNRTLNDIKRSI